MSLGMSLINVSGLSKFYDGARAIEGISFDIKEGEIVGLLGLNGAGKSTILKVLGTFLLPSAGSASIAGCSVEDDPESVRKLIGYLPDQPPLYDEMTTEKYLRFVANLKNVPSDQINSAVASAMEKTNLTEVADKTLGALSHGFRQRVGIAQALVHSPKLLILDEPINGLDPVQIVEMRDLIVSLRKHHTVILSSHILSEITKTCDRILIIDQGKLVAEGTETSLIGRVSGGMRVFCDILPSAGAVAAVRSISGVTNVLEKDHVEAGVKRLVVEAGRDVRADIAKKLISENVQLVGLTKEQEGLERIFMQLVSPNDRAKKAGGQA